MGDRNNPIKFGPEWLRNLARESSAGGSAHSHQNPSNSGISSISSSAGPIQGSTITTGAMSPPGPPGAMGVALNPEGAAAQGAAGGSMSSASTSSGSNARNTPNNAAPKVLLAKLRYGREEMLALYDRSAEAPEELKYFDLLYQPRGKPPVALNNTFEEEMRENIRGGPPAGGLSGDRFGMGRGIGRGTPNESRGRSRLPFVRQTSTGRGNSWHMGNTRLPGYNTTSEDDSNPLRPWGVNNVNSSSQRVNTEQQEWVPNKVFRRRQANNTNWRQPQARDEGDEWRSPDGARNRPNVDKWDREWGGERPVQDRPQSWNSNRRTWVGGEGHNDDNLPEWAVDNAEAGAGTFDSSGAFHGYSNDDTNLPKTQDTAFPLVRSHTHGSFVRSKTIEEGSEEWWASEKAKKLSPKKFDASEIKFKKSSTTAVNEESTSASNTEQKETQGDTKTNTKEEEAIPAEKLEEATPTSEAEPNEDNNTSEDQKNAFKSKFTESKTFDALMRSDIDMKEVSDDRGNFQSVMITPTNSLRQKHQNITSGSDNTSRHGRIPVLQMLHTMPPNEGESCQVADDKLVEEIFDLNLEDTKITTSNVSSITSNSASNTSDLRLSTQLTSGGMPMTIPSPDIPSHVLPMTSTMPTSVLQGSTLSTPGMQASLLQGRDIKSGSVLQSTNMQAGGMQPGVGMQPAGLQSGGGMQHGGMQVLQQGLLHQSGGIQQGNLHQSGIHQGGMPQGGMQQGGTQQGGMQQGGIQQGGMQPGALQTGMLQSGVLQPSGLQVGGIQPNGLQALQPGGLQTSGMPSSGIQNVGIPNSALNSSLGLSIGSGNNGMVLPIAGVQQSVIPNSPMSNPGMGTAALQSRGSVLPGFQPNSGLSIMGGGNVPNSSLFMGQNNNPMQSSNDLQMPNHGPQSNMFPMHNLQHSNSQASYGSIYGNLIPPSTPQSAQNTHNLADQWYYEDPKKIIQGPFSSKEMYNWYRAGFFSPSLMVRRACDAHMRPLGSYGPIVPFAQMDIVSPFPMSGGYETRSQGPHDLLNQQQGLGIDDSLWSQPPNLMWLQQTLNARNESSVNNLPMFFWDPQPSAITSNSLLPEEIAKEMKTEDQILAQLRASQNVTTSQSISFLGDKTPVSTSISNKADEAFSQNTGATPKLEELQKLIQTETLTKTATPIAAPKVAEPVENGEAEAKLEKQKKTEQTPVIETNNVKPQQNPTKVTTETKPAKATKAENEKATKNKDNNATKNKGRKSKEEKKDEAAETKNKEEPNKSERKRSLESSPAKAKKEDKQNKKELEKEKKEWAKEGFTIVKGSEKNTAKDAKKKADEAKSIEDTDRKRKEEDKNIADEKKEKKVVETQKKQQRQMDSVAKKAPWSTATQQSQALSKDITEIQRLEREKKIEEMKVQQQMMQIIAQQQAAAVQREQEMQAGLGWAKKKGANLPGQSLTEIQAEARRNVGTVVTAPLQASEETHTAPAPSNAPWAANANASGFWDPQQNKGGEKTQDKAEDNKNNKGNKKNNKTAAAPVVVPKKESTPTPETEFETWCTSVLNLWSTKIDVPTFVGFLKDIESPYEVKDYVKFYLGESKDAYDFARQFLERRSKLMRVGMVTPSDDLCSPAMAINPRTPSGSDYQEVKGKGKKSKKNKMLKVDARILGFSVTAAEDRINVGDIDTA